MTVNILGVRRNLHNYRMKELWLSRNICERYLGVLDNNNFNRYQSCDVLPYWKSWTELSKMYWWEQRRRYLWFLLLWADYAWRDAVIPGPHTQRPTGMCLEERRVRTIEIIPYEHQWKKTCIYLYVQNIYVLHIPIYVYVTFVSWCKMYIYIYIYKTNLYFKIYIWYLHIP